MHKREQESILIKALAEGHTVGAACNKAGISRMNFGRLRKGNLQFAQRVDEALLCGIQANNDRAMTAFTQLIIEKKWPAVRYRLEHHVDPYLKKDIPLRSNAGAPRHMHARPNAFSEIDAYEQFIRWSAMTAEERAWGGIETRERFCKAYRVPNANMLGIWSQRKDFEPRVTALREKWVFSKTNEILGGVYAAARSGDHKSQRLWLEHVHHMAEKRVADTPNQVTFTEEDIRFLIEALPEPQKSKHYGMLRDLLTDSTAAAQAGTLKQYQDAGILDDNGEVIPDPPNQIYDL